MLLERKLTFSSGEIVHSAVKRQSLSFLNEMGNTSNAQPLDFMKERRKEAQKEGRKEAPRGAGKDHAETPALS